MRLNLVRVIHGSGCVLGVVGCAVLVLPGWRVMVACMRSSLDATP